MKYVKKRPKTSKKNKKLAKSWMHALHHLVLLRCAKIGLLFLAARGQKKYIFKMVIFDYLKKRLVSAALSQSVASKTTTFLETK